MSRSGGGTVANRFIRIYDRPLLPNKYGALSISVLDIRVIDAECREKHLVLI
jgi:hypothetical protein